MPPSNREIDKFISFYFRAYLPQLADVDAVQGDSEPDTLDSDQGCRTECIWAYSTAEGMVHMLYKELQFRYEDRLQLSSNAKERSLAVVSQLLSQGYLTKQAKVDRDQPLGVYHIFHMVEALF